MSGPLSYDVPGATRPADADWGRTPRGHRRQERTVRLGQGDELWTRASAEVLRWGVKTRSGFAYGTRPGHPVSGEEAFVVHRDPDGTVRLTLRSLTRPARGPWRPVFPVLLVAQRVYLRRYARALVGL